MATITTVNIPYLCGYHHPSKHTSPHFYGGELRLLYYAIHYKTIRYTHEKRKDDPGGGRDKQTYFELDISGIVLVLNKRQILYVHLNKAKEKKEKVSQGFSPIQIRMETVTESMTTPEASSVEAPWSSCERNGNAKRTISP